MSVFKRDVITGATAGMLVGLPIMSYVLLSQGSVLHAFWVALLIVPTAFILHARLNPLPVKIHILRWPADAEEK